MNTNIISIFHAINSNTSIMKHYDRNFNTRNVLKINYKYCTLSII